LSTAGTLGIPGHMPVQLRLYSRPGCHLCEEMKEVIASVATNVDLELEEVDISGDPQLEAEFGTEIPVLFINGRKAFKYRLTAADLRKRLRRGPP